MQIHHDMPPPLQFLRQIPGAPASPSQWRLRVASGQRFHQIIQDSRYRRIGLHNRFAASTLAANPRADESAPLSFLTRTNLPDSHINRVRDIPVASDTAVTPPHPIARASAAAHCRRIRSSITATSVLNFRLTRSTKAVSFIQPSTTHPLYLLKLLLRDA